MPIIWDAPLIVLSMLVAILGSFAAFAHGKKVCHSSGLSMYAWLFAGASTLGLAIWASHFIGILAFRLPIHVDYDPVLALLSILPAVICSLLGFYVLRGPVVGVWSIVGGGMLIGLGINLTHFACIATFKLSPPISYAPLLFPLSVLCTVAATSLVLQMTYRGGDVKSPSLWRSVLGAAMMGGVILLVHYIMVLNMRVSPDSVGAYDMLSEPRFMAMLIFLVSLFWFGGGIIASLFDQRMVRQNAEALEKLQAAYDKLEERAQHLAKGRSRLVLDKALDAVINIDITGRIIEWNKEAERIFGYRHDEAIDRPVSNLIIPPVHREAHCSGIKRFLQTGEAHILGKRTEITAQRKDGTEFPVELTITVVHQKDETFFSAFVRDITDRKLAEQKIHQLAFYDALTQLPNRRLLLDRLRQAFLMSARSNRYGAVLFLDLDHFKTLNDIKGHDIGDLLLLEVARRLESSVHEGSTVARLGGDEFVVALELGSNLSEAAAQAELIAENIRVNLSLPYRLKEYTHHTTPSIGIALFKGDQESVDDLLKHADTAMYQAKKAGRNAIRFYDPVMQATIEARANLEEELRQAIVMQQFRLYYQIQVDNLRRSLGAEVLLRWEHPERGLISPMQFIPLSEETGLIVPIGLWVLKTACQQLHTWQNDALTRDLTLAVNVSAKQFRQEDFVTQIQSILLESGAKPSHLKLELTESTVLENVEDTITKMRELKLLGVDFSMDDFGTGYSSLQYLKRLPLDQIKIDQSFVRDIASDPNDAAIVQTIIAMTRALGLNIIAEGVETKAQMDFLDKNGCHYFQGYLFSKPVPLEQFEKLLHQG